MTPTPISPRSIDAMVAREVFGWNWLLTRGHRYIRPFNGPLATGDEPLWTHWDVGMPHYSTQIAAAMEVVKAVKGDNIFKVYQGRNNKFDVTFSNGSEVVGGAYDCESLELAICLAALRAKGIEPTQPPTTK